MARRLINAKLLPEPAITYCQLEPYEQSSVELLYKWNIFFDEIAFENVVCPSDGHLASALMCKWNVIVE